MEYVVLHLKLMGGVRETVLACVVWHYVKVAKTLFPYSAYLNFDKEIIARSPLQLTQCQAPEDSGLARHEECWYW